MKLKGGAKRIVQAYGHGELPRVRMNRDRVIVQAFMFRPDRSEYQVRARHMRKAFAFLKERDGAK